MSTPNGLPHGCRWSVTTTLLLASLLLAQPLLGQEQLRFKRWGAADGLSQNTAIQLHQGASGFLWVATQDGLNRHDGRRLTPFRTATPEGSGAVDDLVRAVVEDVRGVTWFGTANTGLHRLDPTGVVRPVPPPDFATPNDAFGVEDLLIESDTTMLAATATRVVRFYTDTERWGEVIWAGPDSVYTLAAIGNQLWLGGTTGSVWTGPQGGDSTTFSQIGNLGGRVRAITLGPQNRVLVGTEGGGVAVFDGSEITERWSTAAGTWSDPSIDDVLAILTDRAGGLWIGTRGGLLVRRTSGEPFRVHTRTIGDDRSLPNDQVHSLLEDRSGVLWVGTWNGLASLSPYRSVIEVLLPAFGDRAGLSGSDIVGLAQVENGDVWIGALGGALDVWDPVSGAVTPSVGIGADVFAIAPRSSGGVWVATMGEGLFHVVGPNSTPRSFDVGPDDLPARYLQSLFVDSGGDTWLGSLRSGLFRASDGSSDFRRHPDPRFDSTSAWPIVEDGQGDLWVGIFGSGVYRLDSDRQIAHVFRADPEDSTSLSDERVLTLHAGPDGSIWVGTQGGGLNRIDPRTAAVQRFTVEDGLPHDHVQSIASDSGGRLWLGTSAGLVRFDPNHRDSTWVFRESAGLPSSRFFANSAITLRDGRLVFGGEGGVTVVDPTALNREPHAPSIRVTGLVIGGETAPLGAWTTGAEPLVLEKDQNFFSLEFTALDYIDPSLNRYRYRLVGYDPTWNETTGNGFANYTKVRHGRYPFEILAANAEGTWTPAPLEMEIVVLPPYYHTWWFRALAFATVAAGLLALHRSRIARLERLRIQEEREKMLREAQRIEFATQLHNDVGAYLSTIRLRAGLTGDLPPAALDWARKIEDLTLDAINAVRDMLWVIDHGNDTLSALTEQLHAATERMLGGMIEYEFHSEVSASDDPPAGPGLRADVRSAFHELLQNVQKHADATKVTVHLSHTGSVLTIRVEDDGSGMGRDRAADASGSGLTRVQHLAQKHGGRLDLPPCTSGTRAELTVSVS